MKRKQAVSAAVSSKLSKRFKVPDKTSLSDDGEQGISDDGMDVVQLGHGNFSESGTSEDAVDDEEMSAAESEEDEHSIHMKEHSGERFAGTRSNIAAFRAPTTQEIRAIKEASDLFKSSSFKLQIEALLPSVAPRSSHLAPLEKVLFELHSVLSTLPSISPQHPVKAAEAFKRKGVAVPYPSPPPTEDAKFQVAFAKPSDIKVVGSWGNKLSVLAKDGQGFDVDLALEMPSELFDARDYLNSRFFHKRAFFLAVVAEAISNSDSLSVTVQYCSPQEDARRTHLVLRPNSSGSTTDFSKSKASIRIHLSVSSTSFPVPSARFSPSHSNLRISNSTSNQPTPIYNNIILQSYTPTAHLLSIFQLKSDIPAFSDALNLLRIWANQRGYSARGKQIVHGFEVIGGSWWALLLGFLVSGEASGAKIAGRKPLGRGLSSYQLFRGTMDFLAKHDFESEPVIMKPSTESKFPSSEFSSHHKAVFVDPSSTYNFLSGVPIESMQLLRYDASTTLQSLDRDPETFTSTFLTDVRDLASRFDTVICVNIGSAKPTTESPWATLDHGSTFNALIYDISAALHRALGTRVFSIAILHSASGTRALSESTPHPSGVIDVGLILNPAEAGRLVDHGPPAGDEVAGKEFREFWGPRAELRRFKDGSIQESVVWDVPNIDERIHIPFLVVQHILKYRFGIASVLSNVTSHGRAFDALLHAGQAFDALLHAGQASTSPSAATGSRQALTAFESLVRAIKGVEEDAVPLSLSHIAPVSDFLRHTSVFPPSIANVSSPHNSTSYISPIDIIISYEQSSKWPEDLAAIQKVKLAFLETLARQLRSSVHSASIALDADSGVIEDNCALELVTRDGFAFRARIFCELEKPLLKRFVGPKPKNWKVPTEYSVSKPDAKNALALHERRFAAAPAHHNAISALHHRYPSFGPTTRMVKRWFGAHMLLPHIPSETIEILCAYIYLCPGAFGVPATANAGFVRAIRLLKEWDYKDVPLCVPLYADAGSGFDAEKLQQVESLFKEKVGEASWTVVTEKDLGGTAFGPVLGPRGAIPARIKQVALATWRCLCTGMENGNLNVKELFTHPLDDYDFVIHLDPAVLPRYHQNAHFSKAVPPSARLQALDLNMPSHSSTRIDFDPAVLLYEDLQRVYAETAVFFFDPLGGAVIAGVWNPQIRNPRPFKVFAGYSVIVEETNKDPKKPSVKLNERAVLAEIERMGSGIIQRIVVTG